MCTLYTTTEAAAQIGASARTIRRLCETHGVGLRLGRQMFLAAADVKRLAGLYRGGPGNPNFGTTEAAQIGVAARKSRVK